MTQDAIKRLLVVSGLVVLLLILVRGTALPLHAAPLPQSAGLQGTEGTTLQPSATVTGTPGVTVTLGTASTQTSTQTPTTPPSPTATPSPTSATSPLDSPLPSPTQMPSAVPTLARPSTSTPAPTKTSIPTPMPTATLTPLPTPTALPTLSPFEKALTYVPKNSLLIAAICLIPLLTLGLLLILSILWKKRPRPTPSPPLSTPPLPPPPTSAGPYLESVAAPGSPQRLYLKPEGGTIGLAPENDLVITQDFAGWESMSRRHARIFVQAGRWIVEDLDSTNGVYVNGRRTGRNLLRDGWRLNIGGVEFVFHTGAGEEQS